VAANVVAVSYVDDEEAACPCRRACVEPFSQDRWVKVLETADGVAG
jgi:hypothetical protein